jgi:hypothetical protein
VSAADTEFLFDVAKLASGMGTEVREVFRLGRLLGYKVELRSGERKFTLEIATHRLEDREAVAAYLREAIARLLARENLQPC